MSVNFTLNDVDTINACLPLWCALANLFLDTEITPYDYERVRSVSEEYGFSLEETLNILENDIFPVFIDNLRSVAGEWSGFCEENVREVVQSYRKKKNFIKKIDLFLYRVMGHGSYLKHLKNEITCAFSK